MSERDLRRIAVLTEVLAGRRTVVSAAAVLALGVRQTFRLLARYQDGGGGALIHKARGRTSNNRLIPAFAGHHEIDCSNWLPFPDCKMTTTRSHFSSPSLLPSASSSSHFY